MKEIWEIKINQRDENSLLEKIDYVTTDNESVFIRTYNDLRSYNHSTGKLIWNTKLKHWNVELCYNNNVILVGVENELICIKKKSGEINWKTKIKDGLISKIQLNNNKCFVITGSNILEYSLDGKLTNNWNVEVENINRTIIKATFLIDEILYFIIPANQTTDYLMAYDYGKCEVLWKSEVDNNGKYLFNNISGIGSYIVLSADIHEQQKHLLFKNSGKMLLAQQEVNAYTFIDSDNVLIANNKFIGIENIIKGGEILLKENIQNSSILRIIPCGELYYCLFSTRIIVIDHKGRVLNDVKLTDNGQNIHHLIDDKIIITFKNNTVKAFKSLI